MTSQTTFAQKCPTCGRRIRVPVYYMGMTLTCQHCSAEFEVRDESSIFNDPIEDKSVADVFQTMEDNLQKSGILCKNI
ncbi:MAG: hypothetical protein Q4D38_03295 [Planctomycetia bacterium]|nr:hypothetical protein [Planctomycetia bacterium]